MLLPLCLVAISTSPVAAQTTVTVPTTLDTYVQEDQPTTNFGSSIHMNVRGGSSAGGLTRYSLMRFDVPSSSAPIQNVTLQVWSIPDLKIWPPPPALPTHFYYLPNASFTEHSLTWANMGPHIAGAILAGSAGPSTQGSFMNFDVTNFVQAGSTVYFGMATDATVGNQVFSTKEGPAAQAPRLVVTYPTQAAPALEIKRSLSDPWNRFGYPSVGNLGQLRRNRTRVHDLILRNSGNSTLHFTTSQATIAGSDRLTWETASLPSSLAPGASATLQVKISSNLSHELGRKDATVTVPTLELGPQTVDLWTYLSQGRECDPGPLVADLGRLLQGAESSTVGCWHDSYLNFQWGGSQNIPVLTTAVRLYAMDDPASVVFFQRYVDAALNGAAGGPGQPPARFKYLLPEELGGGYDAVTVTGVLAAHVWARENVQSALLSSTGRWLRAYFTLAAISTAPTPAKNFVDEGIPVGGHPAGYQGPWLVLAGQRSCAQDWGFTVRSRLISRALGLGGNAQGAANYETVWARLETLWNGANWQSGDLYGLSSSQRSQLNGLVTNTACPTASTVTGAFNGIKTQTGLEAAGWSNAPGWGLVRASTSGAVNQNNLFGAAYVTDARLANGQEVHVLWPWDSPPYTQTCGGTQVGGTVDLVLNTDDPPPPAQRMVLTPLTGSATSVDLPVQAATFSFEIGPAGLSKWTCSTSRQ